MNSSMFSLANPEDPLETVLQIGRFAWKLTARGDF